MVQDQPIDVISVCSAGGEIRPLRLRLQDDAHQLLRINIDEIVSVKPVEFVGIEAQIFLCKASVYGREWMFELKYSIRTHRWSMHRWIY